MCANFANHLTPTIATARARKAGPAVDRLLGSMPSSEFDSPLSRRLEGRFRQYVATSATSRTLSSGSRRLAEFLAFARELFKQQGRVTTDAESLKSNTACRLYLVSLADRNLGKTVVPSAKTMLNTHRALTHPGIIPLDRLKAVAMLLDSVKKNIISRDMQAPGLVQAHVVTILRGWGTARRWDEVMMAAVIEIGFQATLRPIEISCLGSRAVWWVLRSGREVRSDFSNRLPPHDEIKGIIMALLPRKNRQGQMSYLPCQREKWSRRCGATRTICASCAPRHASSSRRGCTHHTRRLDSPITAKRHGSLIQTTPFHSRPLPMWPSPQRCYTAVASPVRTRRSSRGTLCGWEVLPIMRRRVPRKQCAKTWRNG